MNQPMPQLTTLLRREIQSPLVVTLIKELIQELGYDKAMEIAARAIQKDAWEGGRAMAEQLGSNGLSDLMQLVREVWAADQALELEVLEQSETRLRFNVTRCRYAELYDRLGIREFGYCLSCNRDAALIEGFNPHMKLERTKTIMQGATHCDFSITIPISRQEKG